MVQREREKAKRPAVRPKESAAGYGVAVERLEARAKALERERNGLKTELEAARARIAVLEESRSHVASRIDWIVDSLNSLVEKNG
jgi:chromosome segregation ATPase